MAYNFFINGTLLPVTPSDITTKIKNQNKTVNLINESEVNVLKDAGLTEISFRLLLPNVRYPFAHYEGRFHKAIYYLDLLEALKMGKRPFRFIVSRMMPGGAILSYTNMLVSLEEYKIEEAADNGMDCVVSVELKQYRYYGTKAVSVSFAGRTGLSGDNGGRETKPPDGTYMVKEGDTLWNIAKHTYGSGMDYRKIYEANKEVIEHASRNYGKASSGNGWWIYPGTELTMPAG